jgi:hypothetical protein
VVDGVTSVSSRRRGSRWLIAGLAALSLAWVVAPATTPIYDGVGQPDEPYRYVDPPPTAKTTKTPTTAEAPVPVKNGQSGAQFANSAESGPQISVYVPPGALQVPTGVTDITVTAEPLAPSAPLPTDGKIVTNVYRVHAEAAGEDVPVVGTAQQAPSIQMRAPTARQPGPVFERRTANGWEQLHTIRAGYDVYQASDVTSFGEFALVELNEQPSKGGGGGINVTFLALGIGVLIVAAVIFVIRSRRTSGASD